MPPIIRQCISSSTGLEWLGLVGRMTGRVAALVAAAVRLNQSEQQQQQSVMAVSDGSDRMSCTARHRRILSTRIRCRVDALVCLHLCAATFRCCSFSSSSSFCSSMWMGAPKPKHSRSFAANTLPSALPMAIPDARWCSHQRDEPGTRAESERGTVATAPVAYESPPPSRYRLRSSRNFRHEDHQN